jgi:hypothetical protein
MSVVLVGPLRRFPEIKWLDNGQMGVPAVLAPRPLISDLTPSPRRPVGAGWVY